MPDVLRSPELEAVTRRFMTALAAGDADARVGLLSENTALVYVGTAEREVWDAEMLRRGYADYVRATPPVVVEEGSVVAHECGQTGWSVWTGVVRITETARTVPFRVTLTFLLERGNWKIVQVHNSTPTENAENLGVDSSALDNLMEAAREVPLTGLSGVTTIMFTDIADSTALAEALGDARWSAAAQAHVDQIGAAVAAGQGRLIKSLGDGTMSSFASAGAAMQTAAAIQHTMEQSASEPRLQVRIGLHTGDVVAAGDDFIGTVVNKAARIAAAARPGEIRVSDATRAMVGTDRAYRFADETTAILKGLNGDHVIHRLEWRT